MAQPESISVTERMFYEIKYLMVTMAKDIANPNYWQLGYEEVLADLYCKMAEVVWEYEDKPFGELKRIVISSLHKHKVTLTRQVYGTHRALEIGALDLDELEDVVGAVPQFNLGEFIELLSPDAERLAREVLEPSKRSRYFMLLFLIRRKNTFKDGDWTFQVSPLLMERVLGWSTNRLETAWKEVEAVLRDLISENV